MGAASAKTELPQAGETFAGKYKLVRIIGEGGMGVVYEATHQKLRQRVAVKVLLPKFVGMPEIVQRFEREGRMAAQLRSRHVAQVLDVDVTQNGLPYMVMEYLEGRDLDVELGQRGPLPIAEAVVYVLQACEAMREAHEVGIVHRDLKPANLFVCPSQDGPAIKVLDFGISKSAGDDDARLTGTHATVGTPLYMSPEQVRSAKNVDLRSDIWSLGVILYELLAGRPPFEGSTTGAAASIVVDPAPSLRMFRPEVSLELEKVVMRTLEKDPALRFQDVPAFADALMPFAAGYVPRPWVPASVPPPGVSPSGRPPPPDPGDGASGGPLRLVLANAATVSYRDAGSGPARVGSPATSPGWTQGDAPRPKRTRTIFLLLASPVIGFLIYLAVYAVRPGPSLLTSLSATSSSSAHASAAPGSSAPSAPSTSASGNPASPTTAAPEAADAGSAEPPATAASEPGASATASSTASAQPGSRPPRGTPGRKQPPASHPSPNANPGPNSSPNPPATTPPAASAQSRPLFLP